MSVAARQSNGTPPRRAQFVALGAIAVLLGGATGCEIRTAKTACEDDGDCLSQRVCGEDGHCEPTTCDPLDSFLCADGSCAPEESPCDGLAQCLDGSDEFITWSGCITEEGTCRQGERAFSEVNLPVFLNCASCHVDGRPSGAGEAWGPAGDLSTWGWHTAFSALVRREPSDASPSQWAVVRAFAGADNTHPEIPVARRAALTWAERHHERGSPDCGVDCRDYSSRTAFIDEHALAEVFACASCHIDGSPAAAGSNWGPGGDTSPEGWYEAVSRRLESAEALDGDVEASRFFRIWSEPSHAALLDNEQVLAARAAKWIERRWNCPPSLRGIFRDEEAPPELNAHVCTGPIVVQLADNFGEPWTPQTRYRVSLQGNGLTEVHLSSACTSGTGSFSLNVGRPSRDIYVLGEVAGEPAEVTISATRDDGLSSPDDPVIEPLTYTFDVFP